MAGEGFILQMGKLRTEVVRKRHEFRRAEDALSEAEHKFQEAVVRYNQALAVEPAKVPKDPLCDGG